MNDIRLDDNHDLLIEDSDLNLTTDITNVIHQLMIRLQFFRSEWFLDVPEGIPYIDEVLIKKADLDHIKALYVREITRSDGVDELLSLELSHDSDSRGLRVDFAVKANGRIIKDSVNITI